MRLTWNRLHTLSATELYTAHLTPYFQQATDDLNSKLQRTQQENAQMMTTIDQQRAEIERLLNGLNTAVKDIEGSVEAIQSQEEAGVSELRSDIWQMEQEVALSRT